MATFYQPRSGRSTVGVGQKKNNDVSFLLPFLPLSLEYFQLVPLYGCLWTCLDPSIHIKDNLDPRAKFWVQGPFGPKFKNCNFLTKPYNLGVYRLAWTPKFIFKIISSPGAKFWVQGPFGPKLKSCYFPTKPSNIGVYGLAWIPATTLKVIWTRGPNFWSKGPLAPNSKICNFLTKPHKMGVYGITWTPAIILG